MNSNAAYGYVGQATSGLEMKSNTAYGQVQYTVPTDSTPAATTKSTTTVYETVQT